MRAVPRFPARTLTRSLATLGAGLLSLAACGLALAPVAMAQRPWTNGPQSVAPVASRLVDAVVNISTSQVARGPRGVPLPNVPKGSPFEEYFDDFFDREGRGEGPGRKVASLGSGFVIDGREGLVVTNNHVIADADEIIINFANGSKLKVDKVLGRDPKTDLALLKVTPVKPLPEVRFGSSARLQVGDWVMAIGNPFGLGGSVTVGIISAKERDINSGPYDDYLQTDAAINKGNSGGPLFDMDGNVIGVNTAIISPTGGSIGIGFAVPSDTAVNVIEQLKLYGETRRGWLGVRIQSVTEDLAGSFGVEPGRGAVVSGIEPDSPAAKAGIRERDVIITFDGKDVTSMRGLPRLVAQTPIGKEVEVGVLRDKKPETVKVVVGRLQEAPASEADAGDDADEGPLPAPRGDRPAPPGGGEAPAPRGAAPQGQGQAALEASLGFTFAPLDEAARQRFGLGAKVEGLVVLSVKADGAAGKKGFKEGDVVVEAAGAEVRTAGDLEAAMAKVRKAGRKAILLRLEDAKGDLRFVALPLGDER
ncbi:MAG: trypsin-like peptidase domain-containing protein [Hyphomicrobiaceae bacterium]|nr:trypsin-like peptidase domain-containing protein [Hyphomicrobiaceae bacterium]